MTEEDIAIESWNREQYERIGFDTIEADEVVSRGVDYHEVETLISKGCPPKLAVEILL